MPPSSLAFPFLAASLALLSSCAAVPRQILRIEPLDTSEIRWIQGVPHMTSMVDQVRLEVAFKASTPEGLEFSIGATNRGSKTLDFNPRQFRMTTRVEADSSPRQAWAEDPPVDAPSRVQALQSRVQDLSRESNPYGPPGAMDIIFDGVVSLITRTVPTPAEKERNEAKRRERATEWDREHQAEIEKTRTDLDWWKSRNLERNSLDSGATISGSLLFRMRPRADELEIRIPVRDTLVSFPFSQKIFTIQPGSPTTYQ